MEEGFSTNKPPLFREEEYPKVYNFRSVKQMWDTLAVTYEGTSQKKKKTSLSKKQVLKSSFKALKVDDSSNDEYEEDFDGDELAFISRKICKILSLSTRT
ncbi:hypothetical protein GmHk_10G028286 [Glycine max]|nr:hypothetical protein GmHk_10G028286 [Glycine max]